MHARSIPGTPPALVKQSKLSLGIATCLLWWQNLSQLRNSAVNTEGNLTGSLGEGATWSKLGRWRLLVPGQQLLLAEMLGQPGLGGISTKSTPHFHLRFFDTESFEANIKGILMEAQCLPPRPVWPCLALEIPREEGTTGLGAFPTLGASAASHCLAPNGVLHRSAGLSARKAKVTFSQLVVASRPMAFFI